MLTNLLVITVITTAAWASLFPEEALALIGELKRLLRRRVIQRTGEDAAQDVGRKLHVIASQRGIDPEIVEEVLAENHDFIVERLGAKYADEILDEPTSTRRDP